VGSGEAGLDWEDARTRRVLSDAAAAAVVLARADALAQRALVVPWRRCAIGSTPLLGLAETLASVSLERPGLTATELTLAKLMPAAGAGADPLTRHGLRVMEQTMRAQSWADLPDLGRSGDRERADRAVEVLERRDVPALGRVALAFATLHHVDYEQTGGDPAMPKHRIAARAEMVGMTRLTGVISQAAPLSAGLSTHGPEIVDGLQAFRHGWPLPIISCFTEGALRAAEEMTRMLDDVAERCLPWAQLDVRRDSLTWQVMPGLLATPAVTVAHLIERFKTTAPTAMRAITALENAGILSYHGTLQRHRTWVAPAVVEALDTLARRATSPT
jgi:hypothetical protein